MNATSYFYVCPTDSLFVRGNLAFGDGGEHGTSAMPPPPSLFAGAFRSALLGLDAAQLTSFSTTGSCTDPRLIQCLGAANNPGGFRISWVSLAAASTAGAVPEAIANMPADLLVIDKQMALLEPRAIPDGVQSAGDLPLRATLVSAKQEKPATGMLLRTPGFSAYLQGQVILGISHEQCVESKHIYQRDPRLGIGLNTNSRTAEEKLIYTTEGFAFSPKNVEKDNKNSPHFHSTGFLVGVQGVANLMPDTGELRLGGDGRSASYRKVVFSAPDATKLLGKTTRFRLILQTPGLFRQGWLPEGVKQDGNGWRLEGNGFTARLVCAALGRRETVSGWDLYQNQPKPAQGAVPAGSVYWFDELAGDVGKLAAWAACGVWPEDSQWLEKTRRAEGYNCALLGTWN